MRGRGRSGGRANGGAGSRSNNNNNDNGGGGAGGGGYAGDPRLAGLTPLGLRPMSSLVPSGAFKGMPAALVQQTLAVMPQLVAQGPQALRGQRGLAAAAVPAVAAGFGGGGGGGGGGGVVAAAQAGVAAAQAAIGGAVGAAAAARPNRWDPTVPHFELDREVVVMDVPMRITEFNELVSMTLDGLVRPTISLLYVGEGGINGELVRELVEITTDAIRPALENFVTQLSTRSVAARIAIDTTRHRAYLDRLAATTRGTHRAEIIRQLQQEYNDTIQPLGPALEQDPSIAQRTWCFLTRTAPPAARGADSLLFRPDPAAPVGPVAPPGVAAGALPAVAAAGGAVAGYVPSERDIRRRDLIVRRRLRRTYEASARFIQNYRIPERTLESCPTIMKSLYTNILNSLVDYTTLLINTIGYRFHRQGVMNRAHSTAQAQAALVEESGDDQVELTFQNLRGVAYVSRDQIDFLMDQLLLIAVNYMNLSAQFSNLLPLISQIYGVSTVYVTVADGDQDRGINGTILGGVFSEHLQQLVADITREAVVMSDRYNINGNSWFNSDGLVGKLGTLATVVDRFTLGIGSKLKAAVAKSGPAQFFSKTTLAKLVLPTKRVQVQTTSTEASGDGRRTHTTTVGRQTHYAVAAEAAAILGDIAHPVWVAFDRLLELVDPVQFNETVALADGTRTAVRGNLRVAGDQALEIGEEIADSIGDVMSRLNRGLHGRLAAVGASGHAQTIVNALAGLDDESARMIMGEVANQGQYQQTRACLFATQGSPNRRELDAMKGTPLSRRLSQAAREGERVRPLYVSVRGQAVANTKWDRYAVFVKFYAAFTQYSIAEPGTGRYNDFSAYIHSALVFPHLDRFTLENLQFLHAGIDGIPRSQDWTDRYGELMRLVELSIHSKRTLAATMENQSNNENSYHPSENNNINSNGNNNNNNNGNGNGNGAANYNNNNGNGYAPNAGPFAPGAAAAENNNDENNDDYGYAHGHDVITGIKYIVNFGNTETVKRTPEYASWLTYVNSVQFAQWLDSFTNAQLDGLEQEIRFSLLYRNNDPLAAAILQKVIDERNSSNRRPPTTSAAQTGFASFFSQPNGSAGTDRERDAAFAALRNNPGFKEFYDALMWFDEEPNGTQHFINFRRFIQNSLPSIIGTFTDAELTQINDYAFESLNTDDRYDDLVQIISQVEIARANYGNGRMNENERNNGSQRSNNTEGYNNNNGMNSASMAQQGRHAAALSAAALGRLGSHASALGSQASELSRQASLASAALGYTGQAPMATPWGQTPQTHQVQLQWGQAADGIEASLARLFANANYENFYDSLMWFDEEDYGSQSFMAFQQYIQTRLPQVITRFTDEQIDVIWNYMSETEISDDRYDDLAGVVGKERKRRGGGRLTTGRVNFNALARQNSRAGRPRSRSRNSNSTFSSLNSAERRHWEMFPNNVENALRSGTMADPMQSYSAAKYKSKMAKSKKKGQGKSKAKSKSNRGNGGGGGGGGGGAARKSSKNGGGGGGTRKRSGRSKARSSDARTLERRIRIALAGDAGGFFATEEEMAARYYFASQGGMDEIRHCNSQKLLAAIVAMNPKTPLRRDMIAAASARLREINSQSNNSYNMPSFNNA